MDRQFFPLGKAYGNAFCNRVEETQWLVGNVTHMKHSLLVAPRRYGKSSLAERAMQLAQLPHVKINLHLCTSEQEVADLIVSSVIKLIGLSIGSFEKLVTSIKQYASHLNPKLSFGGDIASLELVPKADTNLSLVITDALMLLESLLKSKNKKAVLFFDEFQELAKISKHHSLEGAIRTAAQEMQHLSIIFSGSIRALLLQMFDDETRPLYKLCRKLKLLRIDALDYQKHLNKIAKKTWGEPLSEASFEQIMHLSNRHPYYVNYLCDVVWSGQDKLPTPAMVKKAWEVVVEEEWSDAVKEISVLSVAQRRVLKFVANHPVNSLGSQAVYTQLSMPLSTVTSAAQALIEKDYIELNDQGIYAVINPLLLAVLTNEDYNF